MAAKKPSLNMNEESSPADQPVEVSQSKKKDAAAKKTAEKKVAAAAAEARKIRKDSTEMKKEVVFEAKAKEPQTGMKQEQKTEIALPVVEPVKEEVKTEPVSASETAQTSGLDRGALFFGGGLLVMGLLLLLGRLLQIPFGVFLWPFIFIVPGILVFLTALSSDSSSGEGLSILGGILTSLGALFLAQSITGLWASWAYAWALVAPTSVGFAQMIYGERKGRDAIVQSGRRLVNIGLTILAVGFVFFELILGISGFGLGRFGLPVFPMMLIFVGLVILVRSYLRNRK
ncbi:MAG: hypothetical protein HPY72_12425 [Anaerolineae bacterium]|nr:hypothetical protein [Anaerolineae bacterium]